MNSLSLFLLWLLYGGMHSFLATFWMKELVCKNVPILSRFYRIGYNIFSLVTLIPLLHWSAMLNEPMIWIWGDNWAWISIVLRGSSLIAILVVLKSYDLGEFLGWSWRWYGRPLRPNGSLFCLSWSHRVVRHPLYFWVLVYLWSGDIGFGDLIMNLGITIYLVAGIYFEEKKLVVEIGPLYARYQKLVPPLIPLPFRFLSRERVHEMKNWASPQVEDTPCPGAETFKNRNVALEENEM